MAADDQAGAPVSRLGRMAVAAGLAVALSSMRPAPAAAAPSPPSVADWIAMTPQQRMMLRQETRSWTAADRTAFWARFDDEMKAITPAQRQILADQAAAEMRAEAPAAPPPEPPVQTTRPPKAIALPPPGDLTGEPD